jgi:hypothetical protein
MVILPDGRVGIGSLQPRITFARRDFWVRSSQNNHEFAIFNGDLQWNLGNPAIDKARIYVYDDDPQGTWYTGSMVIEAGTVNISGVFTHSSDDRLKINEVYITNAIETLKKLKPQKYDKKNKYKSEDASGNHIFIIDHDITHEESGLIAQEIYYDAVELRHLVIVPSDADLSNNPITSSSDPQLDPDYSNWGKKDCAYVNYIGLIPYLIRGIQEQQEIIEAEKTKIETLQEQLADVLTRLTALENA